MNKSDEIKDLAAALCEAQSSIKDAEKNAKNAFEGYDYADLASILKTIRSVLPQCGLSIVQLPKFKKGPLESYLNKKGETLACATGIVSVETILMHISGQWISSITSAPVLRADPKSVGAAITYCRKYGISAMVGIAQIEDIDTQGVDGEIIQKRSATQKQIHQTAANKKINHVDPSKLSLIDKLNNLAAQLNVTETTFKKWFEKANVSSFQEMPNENIQALITFLEGKMNEISQSANAPIE